MGKRSGNSGCLLLCLLPIAFVLGKCSGDSPPSVDPARQPAVSTVVQVEAPALDARFVASDHLNVRTSPNGRLAGHLGRGERVEIHERRDGWARISDDGAAPRWVFERHLCSGSGCAVASPRTEVGTSAGNAHRTSPPRTRWSGDSDYGCPCSSSRNCIGPRGGRYCITSGGNKRYR